MNDKRINGVSYRRTDDLSIMVLVIAVASSPINGKFSSATRFKDSIPTTP